MYTSTTAKFLTNSYAHTQHTSLSLDWAVSIISLPNMVLILFPPLS